ncbi:MAG: FtsX-like permease family protein [Flammeovirgaceae bacterium]|nr:FtsX-like permease family protein [Flammeovirgaceae bacterium]
MIAAISWRNVWRTKLRSLVIIMAIAIGLTGGVLSVGVFNGLAEQKMRTAIDTQTAHIQIHKKGFTDDYDIHYFLENPDKIVAAIEKDKRIKSFSTRTISELMIRTANGSAGVQLLGINPEAEKSISTIWESVVDGAYFEGIKRNPILISQKTAEKLKVKVKSKIILSMLDGDGNAVDAGFRVVGIFKTSSSMFDEATAFVRQGDLQRLTLMKGVNHEITIKVTDLEEVSPVIASLKSNLPDDLQIESWKEVQPELAYISDMTGQMNFLFLGIILFALAFGILNTMLMAIFERIKEIGVLMAVGMNKFKIFMMIVFETIFLALIGGFIGIVISAILMLWLGNQGINLSVVGEGLAAYGVGQILYPQLSGAFYFQLILMVFFTAIFSSIYPAFKALKLKPVEAIHG